MDVEFAASPRGRRDTVLVLTNPHDGHSDLAIAALTARGVPVIRFHTEDFPQRAAITCRIGPDGDGSQTLTCDGRRHDLACVRTVWNRRPRPPAVSDAMTAGNRVFAENECTHLLRALWALLADRFWVNRPEASREASLKPAQLAVARALGFDVPRTLVTNEPEAVPGFVDACGGDAIYKTLWPYMESREDGRAFAVYTRRLTGDDVARASRVSLAPGIFQAHVAKRIELRVTVIGARVFAVEIHSQQSERSRDDWRRYDLANTPYAPHTLPPDVEARCRALVRQLGLATGCLDLILTPDERYVFLEINPDGQWYWLERRTGVPLLEHFVEMLIQATPDYTMPAAAQVTLTTT
jgi:hypothetical protein